MSQLIQPAVDPATLSDKELDALIGYVQLRAQELDQYLLDLAGYRAQRIMERQAPPAA